MKEINIKENKIMSYQDVKNTRLRLKERAVYVMGDKCVCCGYNKCITALEFHHLNPLEKDFTFGQNTNISWDKICAELPKCILVCANCHREIHNGQREAPTISTFIQQRADEINDLMYKLKHHQIHYCKICGIEVSENNELCPKCAAVQRRVVKRPNRDELKQLIRTLPFTTISRQYGVTDNAIRKWCKAYDLPSTKKEITQITDNDWLNI